MNRSFHCIVFCIAAALVADGAKAAPFDVVQTRIVRYSDLNLGTPRGTELLYRRIAIAARAVCGESESPDTFVRSGSFRACVARAIDSSVANVDRPALTAYYEHKRSVPWHWAR